MMNKSEKLGDAPIEPKHREAMNALARGIDEILNGGKHGAERPNGFVLMVFPFGNLAQGDARCNYLSNGANRKDVIALMKEMIARFEGQPDIEGRA